MKMKRFVATCYLIVAAFAATVQCAGAATIWNRLNTTVLVIGGASAGGKIMVEAGRTEHVNWPSVSVFVHVTDGGQCVLKAGEHAVLVRDNRLVIDRTGCTLSTPHGVYHSPFS